MKYKKSVPLTEEMFVMAVALVMEDFDEINKWNVENWIKYGHVPKEFEHLPEAQKALEIFNSPLYKLLKEEGTDYDNGDEEE